MTLSEFEGLTVSQLKRLDIDQLKKIVSEQGQKLNKRLDRISSSSQTNKSAVREVKKSGGRFGVKGLTVKDRKGEINVSVTKKNLISEIKREQNFQKARTGTFRGAKAVQEESGKKILGESKKEYQNRKAKEYREEKKKSISKKKWKKMSKKEKSRIYRESRRAAKQASREYDKKLGEFWKQYHEFKEKHPAQLEIGSFSEYYVGDVKNLASRVASADSFTREEVEKELNKILNKTKEHNNEKPLDIWQTVDKDNPFDVKDTPDQFILRNGRIVE